MKWHPRLSRMKSYDDLFLVFGIWVRLVGCYRYYSVYIILFIDACYFLICREPL